MFSENNSCLPSDVTSDINLQTRVEKSKHTFFTLIFFFVYFKDALSINWRQHRQIHVLLLELVLEKQNKYQNNSLLLKFTKNLK